MTTRRLIIACLSPGPATTTFDGVNMKITGWFNVTEQPPPEHLYWSALNNSDPFMTTRIMYSNASGPRWTYSELALAKIDLADDTTEDILSSERMSVSSDPPSITVEVPALRAVMNCTTRPHATTRRQALYSNQSDYRLLEVNLTLPDICNQLDESTSFTCSDNKMSTQWMYKPGIIGYWAESWTQARTTMGVFGDIDEEGIPKNLTILTCTPYLETVQARAIFDLPAFEPADQSVAVDTSGTPRIETIESTRKLFNHDSFWTLFGGGGGPQRGRPGGTFDKVLPSVNLTGYPSPLASSDGFFQALFQGKDTITKPQSLLSPANTKRLIEAIEHMYRIIMAQSLHTAQGRRIPVTSTIDESQPPPPPIGRGTMINPNSRRFYQSHIATYILIASLATILFCAVFALATFRPKGLVTMEPTSLAVRMSLLMEHHTTATQAIFAPKERTMQEQKIVHTERIVPMEMEPMV
ncbi:MAG: hypothetical protein Q9176_000750 [Flavoplaca citrina]